MHANTGIDAAIAIALNLAWIRDMSGATPV
jgi:hypothetical protein